MSLLPNSGTLGGNDITQGQFKTAIEEQRQFIEDSIGTDSTNLQVVDKISNETIGGTKTFSSFPTTPSQAPSSDYQVANKKYVDDATLDLNALTEKITLVDNDIFLLGDSTDTFTNKKLSFSNFKTQLESEGIGGGLGIGQTWQDVTASRSAGVTYTNSTGSPITIQFNVYRTTGTLTVTVGGNIAVNQPYQSTNGYINITFIVPNGATYSIAWTGIAPYWSELR